MTRATLAIGIVAIAIALLVIVTGISFGLATESTVYGSDVDYWIVPESGSTLATVVTREGPQLGNTHVHSEEIRRLQGVRYATPVLIEVVRMRGEHGDRPEYGLAIGVIPPKGEFEIAGVSTKPLTPGDPHYADGAYDGAFTGEVVLSAGAAQLLNASAGDELAVASPVSGEIDYSYTVTTVSTGGLQAATGELPVAVFHLSELQTLTGARTGDQADQILVQTNARGVKSKLEGIYPEALVVTRASLGTQQLVDAKLPLAISVTALIVGLVVSTLFVATTMGLEIEADRQLLAVLAAVGISARNRLLFVTAFTLVLTLVGGIVGVLLGVVGTVALNYALTTFLGVPAIGTLHPVLGLYGLGVALLTGLLAAPYPIVLARRTDTLAELGR